MGRGPLYWRTYDYENVGSSVALGMAVPKGGSTRLHCRVANATGSPSALTVRGAAPADGPCARLRHPPRAELVGMDGMEDGARHARQAAGTNLVVLSVESPDQGGINLDYVALA